MTLLITDEEAKNLLSITTSIPASEEAFRMAGEGDAENTPRLHMPAKERYLLFRAAALHAKRLMGFKVLTNFGSGPRLMWNFLYSMDSGELLAIVQSRAISNFRTGAATAVAVKYLSAPDASVVGMYGSGTQAGFQLEALCAIRPIRTAHVYSRTKEHREKFCRDMSKRLGIEVMPAAAPEDVPRQADIVVTITKSDTPVLSAAWLVRPGLVVGAGSTDWYKREIDEKLVEQAKLIVVDEKEQAKLECGDLLWPVAHGLIRWDQVEELGDIVAKRVPPPDFTLGTILFKSTGIALEDVAITAKAYELARKQGVGREISL